MVAGPLLQQAELGQLSLEKLQQVRKSLDQVLQQILREMPDQSELAEPVEHLLEAAFLLMQLGVDQLEVHLQEPHPATFRAAQLLFEKGELEYRQLQAQLRRMESGAFSAEIASGLWLRVREQLDSDAEGDLVWAEGEYWAQAEQVGGLLREALALAAEDREEAERRIGLLQLRLEQWLLSPPAVAKPEPNDDY